VKTASLVLVVCSLTLWVACGSKGGGSASFSSAASLSSLQVTPAAGSIATGATQQFTATGKFSDGSSKDVTSSVQWSSTAATVASVSSNGLATGVAAGVVTVTAQSGTVKGTASLTITSVLQQPSLVSLQVMPSNVSIAVAATQQFTVKGTFSDNSTKDMTSSVTWSSSDSTFATINGAGLATGVAVGVLTVTAQSGSVQGTANLTVTNAAANLASLTLSPLASSIPVNTTQQFTATGSYSDGSSRDLTALVSWSSSATANATIDANGLATSVAAGSTTITATLGSVTQSTTLTITTPTITAISITPDGLTLGVGINQQYTVTATYSDGSTQDLVTGVTWSSSSAATATVNNSGLATTVAAGSTTLTATLGSLTDTTTLTVVPANLISIEVSPAAASISVGTASIAAGTTQQFTATGTFDDGSTQVLTSVAWASSASTIATISSAGLASGVGVGSSTISAKSGSVTGTATLTVTGATLLSIAVTPPSSSMAVGTTRQFTATGTFSDSSTQDITASVLWSSSSAAAATINNQGVVISVATGTTTITADLGSVSGSTDLTVSTAHLVSIAITPSNPTIAKGTSLKFTVTGTFSDASTATNLSGVSWKSNHPNIAQVRSSGLAHGKKAGSVTITATVSGVPPATTTLTVFSGTLTAIAITPAAPTVTKGSTQQFTANGTFSGSVTPQDITLTTHWSSSSSSVATIANGPNGGGLATTTGVGTTNIGATSGGVTAAPPATLTVQ